MEYPCTGTMSTLHNKAVVNTLERLFNDMNKDKPKLQKFVQDAGIQDTAQLPELVMKHMREDYKAFYSSMNDLYLAVKPEFGQMLYMLALSRRAKTIVEFGTSFGVSTIYLAAALRDNGGGKLITTEFEANKVAVAKKNLEEAGLVDLVEFREGDALDSLQSHLLPEEIDLVLLDGAKHLYLDLLKRLEPHLKNGAIVAADNADFVPEYVQYIRDPANGYVSLDLAFEKGNELSVRVVPQKNWRK